MAQCPSLAKKACGGSVVPLTSVVMIDFVVNPGEYSEHLVCDQVGTPLVRVFSGSRNDGPATLPDGVWKDCIVGYSNPMGEAPLAQLLLPRGVGVLRVCSSFSSLRCLQLWPQQSCSMRSNKADAIRESGPLLGLARSNIRPAPVTLPLSLRSSRFRTLRLHIGRARVCSCLFGSHLHGLAGESLRAQASVDGAPFSWRPAGRSGRRAVWGKASAG